MLFALTDSPGKALAVLIVYVLVQQIESNVIIPLVMSRTTRLHPALIAIGVVVVGQPVRDRGAVRGGPDHLRRVILTEEIWVREIEAAHENRATVDIALAGPEEPLPRRPRLPRHLQDRPPRPWRPRPSSSSLGLAGAPQRDPEL